MPERRLLVVLGTGVASIAVGVAIGMVAGRPTDVVVFGSALAAAHIPTLATNLGRRVPLTAAVAAAGSLITGASFPTMIGAGMIGLPVGMAIVVVHSGSRRAGELLPSEPLAYVAFATVASSLNGISTVGAEFEQWADLGVTVVGALGWFAVEISVRTAMGGARHRLGRRLLVRQGVSEWQAFAALVAVGTIFGLTVPALGGWAIPLAAIPYLFSHLALDRAQRTRTTYRQTIRALGRIPEAGGFSAPGHADRTADLALAMGSELGLSSAELERVEEAALLHDIGRLVLNDPAVAGSGYSTRDLAQWSAAIVAEVPHLRPAADVVADHYRPYRRAGEAKDGTVAVPAQIVKIASAYAVARAGGMSVADGLEILHRGSAYDYDPDLVAVLRRVLHRRGEV